MNVSQSPSQTQPLNVIAWTRQPAIPGLGEFAYTDTSFAWRGAAPGRFAGFEVHTGTYYRAFGQENVLRQADAFTTTVPDAKRPQALEDARRAAELIANSPNLAKLREVDSDTFFFGDPDVTPGRGKVLVQHGDDRRYYIGNLSDMTDIAATTQQIARSLIKR